jgi:hypothetical protein
MVSFNDWVTKEHPEYYEEGFLKNAILGASLLGAGIYGGAKMFGSGSASSPAHDPAPITQQVSGDIEVVGNHFTVTGTARINKSMGGFEGKQMAQKIAEKNAMIKLGKHLGKSQFNTFHTQRSISINGDILTMTITGELSGS